MRQWKVVALLVACGLLSSSFAAAQSDDDLRREVEQLKRDLRKVMSQNDQIARENSELRGKLDTIEVADTSLENRINALAETLDYSAGTTVNSVANPITITGEARARSGYTVDRDFGKDFGNSDSEDDEGSYTDARFLLAFEFDFDRDVTTHFSLQANGLYGNGNTPGNNSSSSGDGGSPSFSSGGGLDEVDLYEAWILVRNIFGRKELSAKTGRQEIVLGNEFIFGNNDFFSGETFDGSHWLWENENFALHFIFAKLAIEESLNTRDHPYPSVGFGDGFDDDELYSLYFTLKTIKNHELDLYIVYFNGHNGGSYGTLGNHLGSPSTGDDFKKGFGFDFYYFTFGIRLDGWLDVAAGLDYNIEFAYQTGDLTDGVDVDVEGFAVEVEIGLTFNANNNFRLFVRFLFSEGADDDGDDTGFIPLFPERHAQANRDDHTAYRARYGILDIIPMDNVLTVQLGLTFDPDPDWTLGLTALYAEHDEDVFVSDGSGGVDEDDGIGFEIDVFAEYRYSDQTTFSAGLGFFFPDDGAPTKNGFSLDAFAGDDDDVAILFYLQTRVVF